MKKHALAAAFPLCLLAVALHGYQGADGRRYIDPRTKADASLAPFSGGVFVGSTLYLAGELGTDANNRVPDAPAAEAKAVLDKVQARLRSAGMTMDDLVSVQIFCSDVKHYAAFNEVYRTYFTREYPARAFIGSGGLLFGARFEVQGIAVKR
ncbi:MAG TPA: RidA family protein [Vicinamibacterales bacterium]|nr:RidA family protein [Vicinamibacterales bacterium]